MASTSEKASTPQVRSGWAQTVGTWQTAMAETVQPGYRHQTRSTKIDAQLGKTSSIATSLEENGYSVEPVEEKDSEKAIPAKPTIYRIKRLEPTESMRVLREGRGVCMCRAMGTCPLMAYRHAPPCSFCTDPMIVRYYPTDKGWWEVRNEVKLLRQLAMIDEEDSDMPAPQIHL